MNRKLKTKVTRWIALVSSTACIGGLLTPVANAQDANQAGMIPSYEWRVDSAEVQTAAANIPIVQGSEARQTQALPPIVRPNNAGAGDSPLMLAPIANTVTNAEPALMPQTAPPVIGGANTGMPLGIQAPIRVDMPAGEPPLASNGPFGSPLRPFESSNASPLSPIQSEFPKPSHADNLIVNLPEPADVPVAEAIPAVTNQNEMAEQATALQPIQQPAPFYQRGQALRMNNTPLGVPIQTQAPIQATPVARPMQQQMLPPIVEQQNVPSAPPVTPSQPLNQQQPIFQVSKPALPPIVSSALPPSTFLPQDDAANVSAPEINPVPADENSVIDSIPGGMVEVPSDANVMDPTGVPQYFGPDTNQAPIYNPMPSSACQSCGGAGCNSCGAVSSAGVTQGNTCGTCGPGGCFDQNHVDARFGCAGTVSCARRYVIADIMYWGREDGDSFGGTNRGALQEFDHDIGWQLTFGRRFDAASGEEISYMGSAELERRRVTGSATGSLNANFTVSGGFGVPEVGSFFGANQQIEFQSTEFHSFEYNKVKWSWDVAKTFWGFRTIYAEDFYALFSDDGTQGSLTLDTRNNLVGAHIGGELFYDVGYRLSMSALGKLGGYLNFSELDTQLVNAGSQIIGREDDDTDFSASLDLGLTAHYQLSTQARLRAGVNALWLFEMTIANGNFPSDVNGNLGVNANNDDDMLFLGVSAGLEIFR